jgi:hypothetical protein
MCIDWVSEVRWNKTAKCLSAWQNGDKKNPPAGMKLQDVCQFHKKTKNNYIIVTDMEGNIKIYRLPKGRGTDQWKWYCPSRRWVQYHFHWFVLRPKGSLSILILHSISVTIMFIALKTRIWHIQYMHRNFLIRIIEGFPRRYHLRYYLIWIDYSNCLNGVQLIMRNKMRS